MWRQLFARGTPCVKALIRPQFPSTVCKRGYFFQPWISGFPVPFRNENQLRELERQFDKVFGSTRGWWGEFFPFRENEHPTARELYRLQNPIIEEDGAKKFMLEFDVRRFKPEEITVKTSDKDCTLTVEAKHNEENAKYEFTRKLKLPDGVVAKDLTCRFTSDGVLQIKAPYNPPAGTEKLKDTEINVEHE
ncbi:unnamed protein product [Enterobius vermicularis]|uniref:SHSP domain-containing protein n=1 Tax=Enterobius vermicularis TaxID=51028 RepID=A0A0N4VGN6_ENTVE|nr:unnamed protein product [Enterobius vermicularis]